MDIREKKAITLIALVITVIVLLILAGVSIAMLTGNNGILTQAQKARISTELASYKEQVELYKVEQKSKNNGFIEGSLTAGKSNLFYNTQSSEGQGIGTIRDVIENISDEYFEKMEIIKGELLINTKDDNEIKIAQSLGIKVNPYDIVDGVLLSSGNNLALADEEGTLTIPDNVTEIGEGAFAKEGLKTIIIPGTVKKIAKNAFAFNTTLENVIIQEGVEEIGEGAFRNCSNLKNIEFPESITSIGSACFASDIMLDNVELPSKLTVLSINIFSECSNLKNLELPQDLKEMNYAALRRTSITTLKFPPNLNSIAEQALSTSTLQNIDTSENNYYEFKNGVLYSKNLKTLVIALSSITNLSIENNVETITGNAFANCNKLSNINITENVKSIGKNVFTNVNLKGITVDPNNDYFMTDEKNNLYSADGSILYRLFDTGNVTIRDGVKNVIEGAFVTNITAITLPDSYVGDQVGDPNIFPSLNYLFLPKNVTTFNKYSYRNVKTIEVSSENKYLESINNEYILSKDGTELYWVKNDITDVKIPETVKTIKDMALSYVKAENIVLPEGIEKIEKNAFYDASTKKIEIQSNIKEIDTTAFANALSLSEVIIHKNKNDIAGSPWSNIFGERAIFWVGE